MQYLLNYQRVYFSRSLSQVEKSSMVRLGDKLFTEKLVQSGEIENFISVIPSSSISFMSPDVPYTFKQNSDFLYLTGFKEPSSVVVLSKIGDKLETALFVREKNPKREVWEGPCSGPENIEKLCGINKAYSISELKMYLNSLLVENGTNQAVTFWRYPVENVLNESGPNCVNQLVENDLTDFLSEQKGKSRLIDMSDVESIDSSSAASYFNSSRYFAQLCRIKKSANELFLMKKACDIASEAIKETIRMSHPYISEHILYAKFEYECRIRGAEYISYIPVIAGASRATILHYIRNNQLLSEDTLLLMDAGCQFNDYTSDITRTWPVGSFSHSGQKELYEACLDVQKHCIQEARPGRSIQDLYYIMMRRMGQVLTELGLIKREEHDKAVRLVGDDPTSPLPTGYLSQLTSFCPHDVGHYLGMDVHDSPEVAKWIKLDSGVAITIEPGIYIRSDDNRVPEKYRGVGIRIEDDIVITKSSCSVLSDRSPKEIEEIEDLIRK